MKMYRNIGVLNLTKASTEELESIRELRNIGCLILSKNQQAALGQVNMVNVGDRITVEDGKEITFTMRNGELDLKDENLKGLKEKVYYLVNGRINLGILSEESAEKIAGVTLNGQIIGPEGSYSRIAHRIRMNGQASTYPDGYEFIKGKLNLKEENLPGFTGEESIAVEKLIALDSIPKDFFNTGKMKFYILEEIIATKENLLMLAPFVENFKEVKKVQIPEGYRYYESLTLTEENLIGFKNAKLFVKGDLTIKVPLSMIGGKVDKIIAKTLKILKGDRELIHQYVETAEEISYINPNAFENYSNLLVDEGYLRGREELEIRNYGVLEFDPSIEGDLLEKGLKTLENYGKILCSKELKGIILGKMKENYGSVKSPEDEKKESVNEGIVIENVGVLEL